VSYPSLGISRLRRAYFEICASSDDMALNLLINGKTDC